MLVDSGPGLCMSIYRSTLVPFHIGSMFCFLQGSTQHGIMRVIVGFGSSLTCVPFQLLTILSIVKQQVTTGITRLVSWLGSSTVCCRRSSKDLHCFFLLEQLDDYVLPDNSKFPLIADGEFLSRDTGVGSSQQDWEFIFAARIQT